MISSSRISRCCARLAAADRAGAHDRPAAGTTFVMNRPFDFSVDPADLLDDEAPQDADSTEGRIPPEADRGGK
ncbi:hypothetical protein KIF24_22145 [Micromonospora sp. Llam7]|uniref:hypothetical protein n=1 Tax=Micromonospora tarapacensis TaxID=2835305 RepID=UPI001C828A88|nr:hypothetical protein [Micromonospora tarapacensis]MBX7268447.1 hypothetical protein [Micromonospora tarapacensis]